MIGALLLPLMLAGPAWLWRRFHGHALGLSQVDARWWRVFADYCLGYVLVTAMFIVLDGQPATRSCFLLLDSRCDVPLGDHLGEWGFIYLFAALPLGLPATLYAAWEFRRRIVARK